MKKHVNIPIFIPHYGCPNACVFCNQKKITGKPCYDKDSITAEIDTALKTLDHKKTEIELAFFGGSFTAIPKEDMLGLLAISDVYLKSGKIKSVRLSTRPDAIDPQILGILKEHGVKTIELGLQSFAPHVLDASKRGHSALQSENACKLIKEYGFELIGQMMVGLPDSILSDELYTAKEICKLGCNGARVYPTVVFPETELKRMQDSGSYVPLTTDEAVLRTAEVLRVFIKHGVPVIRIGLCANETLNSQSYADSYHPSVGELALGQVYLTEMKAFLEGSAELCGKTAIFRVARGKISQAIGQKKHNVNTLLELFPLKDVKIKEDDELRAFQLLLDIN